MAFDTGLETDRVTELLDSFEKAGKVLYSEGVVFVRRMLACHTTRSPRLMMGLRRDVDSVTDGGPKRAFMAVYGVLLGYRKGSTDNVFEVPNTLSRDADNVFATANTLSEVDDNVSATANTLSEVDDNVLAHTIPYHTRTEHTRTDVEEEHAGDYSGNNAWCAYTFRFGSASNRAFSLSLIGSV